MICTSCGQGNPDSNRFCGECGASLEAVSAPAATERDPRAYTPKHLADKILQTKSALEGERKHVTVLFADVAGFTSLSERAGPDAMHIIMDRCFRLILPEVHRYEGTVNQFTGDGIMALFGAPLALEDAPRRAIQAALGMQRALEPLQEQVRAEHRAEFLMRIGIHTGLVVVGKIGDDLRMDYTAVGDTTNLANRLQGLARPGVIVTSETTERLVRGFFELRDLGPAEVKGKAEPVRVFEALAERRVSGRLDAAAPGELTPFVGRTQELAALHSAFEAARTGRGQVAFVVGEAGLGKSRLLLEFKRQLGDEPHTWISGQCAALARTTPFGAIVDALRRRFGIEARDDEASAVAKVERVELGRDLDWTLPFVHQLLSLPAGDSAVAEMGAAARRSETFRAVRARFLRTAEQQPLVLVIEDLHWIDTASEELLAYLSEAISTARVLLIFTYRPPYRHPFGDRSYHRRVALGALSEAEMEAMSGSLLESGTLPNPLRELLAEKADGNPFYLEEVTKSLLEQGVLRLRDGELELTADPNEVGVPDSIQDVLAARLDRLPDGPKRAMQVASVIGREFALVLLEGIGEVGDRVESVVEELRVLELILQTAAHPELSFMFKHALTHDVAYESIVLPRRQAYHLMVGAAIEELYGDRLAEHYEALAHHFTEGEEWEQALLYHERSADKAAAAYANHTAAEHCRHALESASRLGERVPAERRKALEFLLGQACGNVSDFAESGEALLRAAKLSEVDAERATFIAYACWCFTNAHDYDRAREVSGEALALARADEVPGAHALARFSQSWQAECDGDFREGRLYDELAQLAEQSGDPVVGMLTIGIGQGLRAEWRGDYRRAVVLCEKAVGIAVKAQLSWHTLFPRWALGLATGCLGQYERAIAHLGEGLELADRLGDRAIKARLLNSLGWCFAEIGCHGRAREFNERAVVVAREVLEGGDPAAREFYANGVVNLAANMTSAGDLDGARELLEPVKEELDRPGEAFMRWRYSLHVLHGLARVALAQGDPDRALSLLKQELEGVRGIAAPKLEARALELEGRALVTMDDRDKAQASLASALEIASRIEYPPVIWRARSLLAELARRSGNSGDAQAEATRARALVESLARDLSDSELQREFGALGERLIADPVAAYR